MTLDNSNFSRPAWLVCEMRAILDFVNYKLWNTNGSITVPPKHTGSLCRVVPSLAPGSSSQESRKFQQEKQRLCFALLAELLEMPARHFSPSWKLAFQTTGWGRGNGTFLIIVPTTGVEKGHFYILT